MKWTARLISCLAVALIAATFATPASAQTCPGVVGVDDFGQYNQEPKDVAMDGDYAYTADTHGMTVYDISDPTSPTQVAQVLLPDVGVCVAFADGIAYVADASGVLHAIDVSDPTAPSEVGAVQTPGTARGVAVSGGVAVVAISAYSVYGSGLQGALQVVDISDPAVPALRGVVETSTYESGVVASGTLAACGTEIFDVSSPGAPRVVGSVDGEALGFSTSGTYLLVTYGSFLRIVDIGDPAAPTIIGSVASGSPHDAAVSGSTAYLAGGSSDLQVVDFANPSTPAVTGHTDVPAWGTSTAVAISGTTVVLTGDFPAGLAVADVSDPTMPTVVGSSDPIGDARDVAVSGSYAFVADLEGDLRVIDVSDPAAPSLLGSVDTGWQTWAVAASGSTVYVTGRGSNLRVVDASNPTAPTVIGSSTTGGSGNYGAGLVVSGTTLFAAVGSLQIVDVSDPTAPETLGWLSDWWDANDVVLMATTAFVAGGGISNSGTLVVVDVADQTAPTLVATVQTDAPARAVALYGSHVLLATGFSSIVYGPWRSRLYIFDVSDPTTPTVVGSVDLPDVPNSVTLSGSNALVADASGGLVVVDVSTPPAPRILERIPTSRSAAGVAVAESTGTAWVASGPILEAVALDCPGCAGLEVQAAPASVATGGETTTVTVTVRDLLDNPVAGQLVAGISDLGTVGTFTDNGDGTYDAVFTSGPVSGTAHISVSVNGEACTITGEVEVVCAAGAAAVPTGLEVASVSDSSITLEWDVSPGAVGYVVYRDGEVADTINDGSTVEFEDTDVLPGTELCYQVSAIDACGGETDHSERGCGSSTGRPESCSHPMTSYPMGFLNGGDVWDAAVSGSLLATADEYGATLWNVADPATPVRLGTVEAQTSGYITFALAFVDSDLLLLGNEWPGRLEVVDVSDPTTPVIVGEVDVPAFDIAVVGTRAFVAGGTGLHVVDISDPTAPIVIGSVITPGGDSGFGVYGVAVSGSHAYVADGDHGLQVVDISDPTAPTTVGSVDTPGWVYGVAMSGDTAYVTDDVEGLLVVDVTDPAAPSLVGSASAPGWLNRVAVSGSTAFVAGGDSSSPFWERGLWTVDVSDPSSPALVGWVGTPDSPMGLAISGTTAFVGVRSSGLHSIDVSDPTMPFILGVTEAPGWAADVAVVGSIAVVGDGEHGVKVLDVSEPTSPVEIGSVDVAEYAQKLVISESTAVVIAGGKAPFDTRLYLVDITDPTAPTITGSLGGFFDVTGVAVEGSKAYLTVDLLTVDYAGLAVVDISNPSAPLVVGGLELPYWLYDVAAAGSTAFVKTSDALKIVDVSDPAAPAIIGSLLIASSGEGLAVSGSYAYFTTWHSLEVVDVSNPAAPVVVGSVDLPVSPTNVAVAGPDLVLVTAEYGVYVVDVSDPTTPVIVAFSRTARGDVSAADVAGSHAFIADGAYLDILELACMPTCGDFSAALALEPLMPNEVGSVTASATDLAHDPLPTLALTGTATAGQVGPFSDLGDGSYMAAYTAPSSEQTATLSIGIGGFECGLDLPVAIVCPSLDLSMTPSPLPAGEVGTLDIVVDDPRELALPGRALDLLATTGSLGPVTDHGDGTYAASFTAPGNPQTVTVTATDSASGCSQDLIFQVGTCSDPLTFASQTVSDTRTVDWCGPVIVGPAVSVEATGILEVLATGSIEVRNGFSVAAGGTATLALHP